MLRHSARANSSLKNGNFQDSKAGSATSTGRKANSKTGTALVPLILAVIFGSIIFMGWNDRSDQALGGSHKHIQSKEVPKISPAINNLYTTKKALTPGESQKRIGVISTGDLESAMASKVSNESLQMSFRDTPLLDSDGVTRLHVVFSTDCSTFQHWQSYLLFFSAWKAGQPGHVTRIASGCTPEEQVLAQEWHERHVSRAMAPGQRYKIHFTPKFTMVMKDGNVVGDYKFFNKPLGLKHWMENGEGMGVNSETGSVEDEDAVVILIDPDMVFLRPIGTDYSSERETIFSRKDETWTTKVQHGFPFAQMYGLGVQWQTFNLESITGDPDTPAKTVTKADGRSHYAAGPPYIGTARDMYHIAVKWTEFSPRVHAEYPYLLAEMYAYCIAAAHLKLPHKLIVSGMISNTGSPLAEAWPFVDKIPANEICQIASTANHARYAVPNVIHYCQRYMIGKWFFGKRSMKRDFFTCESPLMAEPPQDIATCKFQIKPPGTGTKVDLNEKQAKRNAFVLCGMISLLNDAGLFYKTNHCDGRGIMDKTLDLAKE